MDPRDLGGHQLLAAAVVKMALADAINPRLPVSWRDEARAFVASRWFDLWCDVAGLDAGAVRRIAAWHFAHPTRDVQYALSAPLYVRA